MLIPIFQLITDCLSSSNHKFNGIFVMSWGRMKVKSGLNADSEIPWTGEPGGLQSMGSPRARHNWAGSLQ